jgi:transcriptional regulator with XRE-family HTH domain
MDPFANLGLTLRWLRCSRNRTQREMARSAGITRAMLSAYETGKQQPTLDTLGRLLVALGIDLDHLQEALELHQGRRWPGEARERPEDDREPLPS